MQISASYAPQRAYNGSSNNNKGRNINKTVDASSHSFVQFTATTQFCWFSHLPREWGTREAVHGLISSSYLCCHLYVQDEHKLSHVRTMQIAFNTWQLQRLMRIIKTATATVADCRYIYPKHQQHLHQFVALLLYQISFRNISRVSRECVCELPLSDCPFIACEWVKCSGIRYDIQYTIYVNYAAGLTSLRSSRVPVMICIKQTLLPLIADRHLTIS